MKKVIKGQPTIVLWLQQKVSNKLVSFLKRFGIMKELGIETYALHFNNDNIV